MGQKAVFLDRDGVINDNQKPVNQPEDMVLFPGVGKALKQLRNAGYRIFVVTNQGGVGLGYMTKEDLDRVHGKMLQDIGRDGGEIDDIRCCIHQPRSGCACRKPEPGMIRELGELYDVDLAQSFTVGDRDFDIQAGRRAGTRTVFIGRRHPDADFAAPNLPAAVDLILTYEEKQRDAGGLDR